MPSTLPHQVGDGGRGHHQRREHGPGAHHFFRSCPVSGGSPVPVGPGGGGPGSGGCFSVEGEGGGCGGSGGRSANFPSRSSRKRSSSETYSWLRMRRAARIFCLRTGSITGVLLPFAGFSGGRI